MEPPAYWRPVLPEAWRRPVSASADPAVRDRVASLLSALRAGGGEGLLRIEGALRADPACPLEAALTTPPLDPSAVTVCGEALAGARAAVSDDVRSALETAAQRLRDVFAPGVPRSVTHEDAWGNRTDTAVVPLQRVGVFAPGGRAPYPSSVLMAVVPARAAGVADVTVCTPARPDGRADPAVLAAAAVAGADRVFLLGAVPAMAAMAWGLPPVPRADKVVGPGGPFVVEAKRQLFGEVGVDGLPGPSEIVVLCSDGADPAWVAADLVAQAEHGPDGLALMVTDGAGLAAAVGAALAAALADLPAPRRHDAEETLRRSGGPVVAPDLGAALRFAEAVRPEHLSLQGSGAEALAGDVRRAGAVFVGPWAPVAAGDYAAGTDHVLPTAGTACFASGLGPADFVRRMQVFRGRREGTGAWAPAALQLAAAEGFPGHRASIALRAEAAGAATAASSAEAPYVPPIPDGAARLDLNENPFPWPDDILARAMAAIAASEPHRYPRDTERLQEALAAYAGVPAGWCLPANGSDELLLAAAGAWGAGCARAVVCPPTFGMYRRLAAACRVPVTALPLGPPPDFALDVPGILAAARAGGDTLVFLCRPNNPTGSFWPEEDVAAIAAAGVWTVVDEAYIEFAGGPGLTRLLADHPRLCLLRTMSKAFAFAGLRVGYALGAPEALRRLRQAVQPWAVTAYSCAAALEVLAHPERMRQTVAALLDERARLTAELGRLPGVTPYPSHGNFILFRVDPATGWDPWTLFDRLYEDGVVLRRWRDEPLLRRDLRVSVGRPEENDRFLDALRRLLLHGAEGARRGRRDHGGP